MAKASGHNADDGVQIVIEAHRSADYFRVRTVVPAPKPVADDNRFDEAGYGIFSCEDATKLRLDAEHCEVIGACGQGFRANRAVRAGNIGINWPNGRNILTNAGRALNIPEL